MTVLTERRRRRRPLAKATVRAGLMILAMIATLAVMTPARAAEPHMDNPYAGATTYVDPHWAANVEATAVATTDPTLAARMRTVETYPTAVWMDRIAAVTGADGSPGLAGHLNEALAQRHGSTPEVFEVVVYDLPGRDCAALASNGELPATADGLNTYEHTYIDQIATILGDPAYSSLRIVAVIEPDSLPNIVTNMSMQTCSTAAPLYEAGVEYALNKLHPISNVYNYLDMAHSGWLGWSNNASGAVTEFVKVLNATTAGKASIDGFISDTANYTPVKEPYMTATQQVGGQQVQSANFYQFDPDIDEADFAADMYSRLVAAGFSSGIGMLIDTSRDGWGGTARPTGPSTSTDVNTFVNATKIDRRPHRGGWCNQSGAGLGAPPVASPTDNPSAHLDAYVWIKPPGESDGTSDPNATRFDAMCDPNAQNRYDNSVKTNALPGAPQAGQWFAAQFTQLVQNAFPPVPTSSGGDTQPPSAPSNLTVTGTTSSSVSLSWSASTDNVGVAGYDVFQGGTLSMTVSATTATITGLSPSTTYPFTVKARDAAGNVSTASNSVNATTQASSDTQAPSAPANLAVTGTTTSSVSLSWSPSTDNVGVTAYNVFQGTTLAATVTTNSATVSGLSPSTTYSFTVKARDAAGNVSVASNAVSATTQATGTVTDCTQFGTTSLQGGEYLYQQNEWNSTATQCAGINPSTGAWSITQANFNLATNGAPATYPSSYKGCHWGTCTTVNSGLPIQVSKLATVTTSWSTTQVASGAYDVAYDVWFNSTPTTNGQPDGTELMIWLNSRGGVQPFGSQTGTANLAGVSWNVWTGQQTSWKIISYVLQGGGTSFTNLNMKALIDDAVARGSLNPAHYLIDSEAGFEIWQGGQGLGVNSYSFSATAQSGSDTQAPTAPSNLAVTGTTSSSVSLSWSAATDNVGVTAYDVYRNGTLAMTVTGTTATITGLSPSTTYPFTVKARDAAGNTSAASNTATATTQAASDTQAPTVPANLGVTGTTSSSVSLSWSASTDNVGVAAYDVFQGGTLAMSVTGTTATVSGLSPSTTYTFTVKARDAAGNVSAASTAVSATTQAGSPPPTGLSGQYRNYDAAAPNDNQIKPGLSLVNHGTTAVGLSTVTIRYWFTGEPGATTYSLWCDYALVGCANITRQVVALSTPRTGADHYLEVGFTSGAGTLGAGASLGDAQLRLNKTDWSPFTESNDYSWSGTQTSYGDSTKVTVYVNGALVWGTEP